MSVLTVLGEARAAQTLGAAAGLALARAVGGHAALVACWGTPTRAGVLPIPGAVAARGLAARLAAHEMPALARGRLAWLALPPSAAGARDAGRSAAVAGAAGSPAVLVVLAPRAAAIEPLIGSSTDVLVAGDESDLMVELALDGLRERGLRASAIAVPGPAGSLLARAGAGIPGELGRRLDGVLSRP